MMAFKIAGNRGAYDVVDDFDIKIFIESLPLKIPPIVDVQTYKDFEATYFTPSNLIEGLTRRRENIKDIQAIIFDLDFVPDLHELDQDLMKLVNFDMEFHAWQTPSSLGSSKHEGGMRLYIPLSVPIEPKLLPQAVDEIVKTFILEVGINLLNYGADIKASKTVGRLMGLPLQQYLTFSWYGSWRYAVQSKYKAPKHKSRKGRQTNRGVSPEKFVKDYMRKHNVPELVLGHNVHNTLQQLIGALSKAGFEQEQAIEGLEFLSGIPTHGMGDIEKEVMTSSAYK
ncbi:hypothetical protein ESZ50_01195 [Weissella muntiaci]|uniref:Primase C-terminal 1 domain-containing protein n=1 Tax=Weissella muntiaci TaxID=2508881 RepID=A0A6C2C9T0_9LACO|nr:hypothetical protein [Weissella muntiaci]TYC50860.1 hypothetical protein ESZ50_01195 [Weissella muntiaci]